MQNYKPLIFLFVTTMLCNIASFSNAQVQIKTTGILANAGGIAIVEVEVQNKLPINGMEFSIQLPSCMNIIKTENEISYKGYKVYIDKDEQWNQKAFSDFQVIASEQDDNSIKVLTFSPTAKQIKENSKTLIKIDLSVDETFCYDETITISGMKIPALTNDSTLVVYNFDEIDIAVNKAHHTGISNVESEENNICYTIDGKPANRILSNNIYIYKGKKYLKKD